MTVTDNHAALMAGAIESYNRYAQGLDTKDWTLVRDCFNDEIFIIDKHIHIIPLFLNQLSHSLDV